MPLQLHTASTFLGCVFRTLKKLLFAGTDWTCQVHISHVDTIVHNCVYTIWVHLVFMKKLRFICQYEWMWERVYHHFWLVGFWHIGLESSGRHSQKSCFIPKQECKQSKWMDMRNTHTQHTVVLSYLLMHQSFLQQPDMKREGGEIHNEFQNKTAKIYKIQLGFRQKLWCFSEYKLSTSQRSVTQSPWEILRRSSKQLHWKNDPNTKSGSIWHLAVR